MARRFHDLILDKLIDLKEDGSFPKLGIFQLLQGLTMTNAKFAKLFGGPPRKSESDIAKREINLASSIQALPKIVLRMARYAKGRPKENLCLSVGVALNCVANGNLLREKSLRKFGYNQHRVTRVELWVNVLFTHFN